MAARGTTFFEASGVPLAGLAIGLSGGGALAVDKLRLGRRAPAEATD